MRGSLSPKTEVGPAERAVRFANRERWLPASSRRAHRGRFLLFGPARPALPWRDGLLRRAACRHSGVFRIPLRDEIEAHPRDRLRRASGEAAFGGETKDR